MKSGLDDRLAAEIDGFRRDGVYKTLNHLDSPQSAWVTMEGRGKVLILSSNNYLGLCDLPEVIEGGKSALDRSRFTASSNRRSRASSARRRRCRMCRAGRRTKG